MPDELTKDADKMLCILYKEYQDRRKAGQTKAEAKSIDESYFHNSKPFRSMAFEDVLDTMSEISRAEYIEMDLSGNCFLKDKAIAYLESRFKKKLSATWSVVSKFLP